MYNYFNILGIVVAMEKLAPLFYGRNHPIYQKISFYNFKINELMPNEVKLVIQNFRTHSISGLKDTSQGGICT